MNRTLYGFSVVPAYCVRYYYICAEGYTYKQVEYQPDYRAVRSDGGNRGRFGCAREVSDYGYVRGVEKLLKYCCCGHGQRKSRKLVPYRAVYHIHFVTVF